MRNRVKLTTAVPGTANPITNLPMVFVRSNSYHFANGFMARDDGEWIAPGAGLNNQVGVTDARSQDFGQDLEKGWSTDGMIQCHQEETYFTLLWQFKLDLCDDKWAAGLVEPGDFVLGGQIGGHDVELNGEWSGGCICAMKVELLG